MATMTEVPRRNTDTAAARKAAQDTYARRRRERAVAELEAQGYVVTLTKAE